MKKEIWKDIEGYEGLYRVSNMGNVFSVRSNKNLKPCKNKIGYLIVNLSKDKKKESLYVHRLVAEQFIINEFDLEQVNHIDENKSNNSVDNLEWITAIDNYNHGTRNKRISETKGTKILQLDLNGNVINEFHSLREAQRVVGVDIGGLSRCINGKQSKAKGYKWALKKELR